MTNGLVSVPEIENLLLDIVDKGKLLRPKKFADCNQWTAMVKDVTASCLGEYRSLDLRRPDHVDDTPGRAREFIEQSNIKMVRLVGLIRKDGLPSWCTRGNVDNLKAKHGL